MLRHGMQAKRLTDTDNEHCDKNNFVVWQGTQGPVLKDTVLIRYKILKQNPQCFLTL